MYIYINHTHIYNWSPPPCNLTTGVLSGCCREVMAYLRTYVYSASLLLLG